MRPDFWDHPLAPYCVVGPTGSGKTAHAVALAQRLGAEIVNVDAYQIYAGLPILTAQPTPEEQAAAPHHLYGVLQITELCNAGVYFRLASAKIRELQSRGVRPLLVGGGGMYLKCLTHGLNDLPTPDPALRAELEALPLGEIAARLLALDPQAGEHVSLQNPRHALRALEISMLTGKPASQLKSAWNVDYGPIPGILLDPPRPELYARIERRCRAMLASGALEEVAAFDSLSATAAKAIGVAEIQARLRGELSLAETEGAIAQATRRYAKRQVSWFRNQARFTPDLAG
jgi:tRNA dimethylallyltransferase